MTQDLASAKVLIVDDNAHMRSIVKIILDTAGVSIVREASDGVEALAILANWRADVAVVDYHMAPMDGLALTKRLRNPKLSPDPYLPIVMITGHADRERVMAAREAGITEFVVKPVTAKNVLDKLGAAIGKRASIRAAAAGGKRAVHWLP